MPHRLAQKRVEDELHTLPHDGDVENFRHDSETSDDAVSASRKTCDAELPIMSCERCTETIHGSSDRLLRLSSQRFHSSAEAESRRVGILDELRAVPHRDGAAVGWMVRAREENFGGAERMRFMPSDGFCRNASAESCGGRIPDGLQDVSSEHGAMVGRAVRPQPDAIPARRRTRGAAMPKLSRR